MLRVARIVFFIVSFLSLPALYRDLSKGFRLEKLLEPDPPSLQRAVPDNVHSLLAQDFYYLDQGTQSYVFVSEDDRYVIKLFRYEQVENFLYRFIRNKVRGKPLRGSYTEQKERLFSGCRIADRFAREETALISLHLDRTEDLWPKVRLHLPLGRTLTLPLDPYCFAIQEKGERIFSSLASVDSEGMRRKLDSFHRLMEQRVLKGLGNLDKNLDRNFGFVGERAIEIDFGAYHLVSETQARKEATRLVRPLRSWLTQQSPEELFYWDQLGYTNKSWKR